MTGKRGLPFQPTHQPTEAEMHLLEVRQHQVEQICLIFGVPIDRVVAATAARRRITDEPFEFGLQHIKSWIREIEAHAKTHGQALTKRTRRFASPPPPTWWRRSAPCQVPDLPPWRCSTRR